MTFEGASPRPLAYKDEAFLDSDEARPLRIVAEFLEPLVLQKALAVDSNEETPAFAASRFQEA